MDVTRMNELVPEANLPGRASEVLHMHLHLKVHTNSMCLSFVCQHYFSITVAPAWE